MFFRIGVTSEFRACVLNTEGRTPCSVRLKNETLVHGRRARLPPRARSRVVADGPPIFDPRLRARAVVAAVRDSSGLVGRACPHARDESERESDWGARARDASPCAPPTPHSMRACACACASRANPLAQAKAMARQLYQKISKKPTKDATEVGSLADLDEARACGQARASCVRELVRATRRALSWPS